MTNSKPTESELEILQVLWAKGSSTVREVNEQLALQRSAEPGYTTTLKLMQIMLEKGIVTRDSSSRTHIYSALLNEESIQQSMLNKLIDTVFKGSAADLVMQALSSQKSSEDEIRQIKELLAKLDKK